MRMKSPSLGLLLVVALGATACGAASDQNNLAVEQGAGQTQQSCNEHKNERPPQFNSAYVELKRENFQAVIDGRSTDLYTIRNRHGMFVNITNLGAKVEQIVVPDRDGVFGDVALGYESIGGVKNGQPSMGAFMGRYANRIGGGTFTLDGVPYTIAINEGAPKNNVLHGGAKGGRFRVYDATQLSDSTVEMSLTYLDGEDADPANGITGFPGTLQVKVLYSVTEDDELHVSYSARTLDKKTVINFTGHTFST
jgi:aldose 1-epimerase